MNEPRYTTEQLESLVAEFYQIAYNQPEDTLKDTAASSFVHWLVWKELKGLSSLQEQEVPHFTDELPEARKMTPEAKQRLHDITKEFQELETPPKIEPLNWEKIPNSQTNEAIMEIGYKLDQIISWVDNYKKFNQLASKKE